MKIILIYSLILLQTTVDFLFYFQRAEVMTRNMTTEQYLEFSKARQASFGEFAWLLIVLVSKLLVVGYFIV